MNESNITTAAIGLSGLALEYCRLIHGANTMEPRDFCRDVLRYLPRFYITISDLDVEAEDNGAIYETLTEEQYDGVRADLAPIFGEYDVFLDCPAEDMRFSDTPVGVSLSELLADIFQTMADFASTVAQVPSEMLGEVLADLKDRFDNYLSDTICTALRAANNLYRSNVLESEE